MKTLTFTDDKAAESILASFRVTWVIMTVKLSEIDIEESKRNRARCGLPNGIDTETLNSYGIAMLDGDKFPRVILFRRKGKKYLILSGNHRVGAVIEVLGANGEIEVYVIDTEDDAVIDILPRVLNQANGLPISSEEKMNHAIYCIDQYKYSMSDAAKLFRLREETIRAHLKHREVVDVVESRGYKCRGRLHALHAKHLSRLANENVLVQASNAVLNAKMTGEESGEFVKRILKGKTESAQLAVVADEERKLGLLYPPATKIPRQVRTKFLSALSALENNLVKVNRLSQVQITASTEVEEVSERMRKLAKTLIAVAGANSRNGHARKAGVSVS